MNFRQPFKGEYPITQAYGETVTSAFHTGIDYGTPMNTPILASADGVIRFSGIDKTGYGNCVIIEHDSKHATLYAHLNSIAVFLLGMTVRQGDVIGWSGNTGNSTGPHLHFEARSIWNDYRSHFNPVYLPLMSVDDSISDLENTKPETLLKSASEFQNGDRLEIIAPLGAYGHDPDFGSKQILYPGTKLIFTGNTVERNGLTFCECRRLSAPILVAVHDGETQILDVSGS